MCCPPVHAIYIDIIKESYHAIISPCCLMWWCTHLSVLSVRAGIGVNRCQKGLFYTHDPHAAWHQSVDGAPECGCVEDMPVVSDAVYTK